MSNTLSSAARGVRERGGGFSYQPAERVKKPAGENSPSPSSSFPRRRVPPPPHPTPPAPPRVFSGTGQQAQFEPPSCRSGSLCRRNCSPVQLVSQHRPHHTERERVSGREQSTLPDDQLVVVAVADRRRAHVPRLHSNRAA